MKSKTAPHGGAWKVAYADFVTAMMALFIVLWIIKDRPQMAEEIARQFPHGRVAEDHGGGPASSSVASGAATPNSTLGNDSDRLHGIARDIQKLLKTDDAEAKAFDVQVTADGLSVVLFDQSKRPLFEKDSAQLTKWGEFVINGLSWIIERKKMLVFIEGHTAATADSNTEKENAQWNLSTERANASRKALVNSALEPKWITRLSGYGSSKPLPGLAPTAEQNERITLNLTALK